MSAQDIANRIEHCRQTGSDTWIARCPAHEDRSPSLSIKDVGDGRTLIHCHAGCGALDVLDSLGLDWSDLYPPKDDYRHERARVERSVDDLVVEIAMADMRAGKSLSDADKDRCRDALQRMDNSKPSPQIDPRQMEQNVGSVGRRYAERAAILANAAGEG